MDKFHIHGTIIGTWCRHTRNK